MIAPERAHTHTHTHTHTHISSSIANLTAQLVLYQNKIQWAKHQRARLCVTVRTRLKYKAYSLHNKYSLAFRYVTSQIWKYNGIFGFVPNERGRLHEHKAPFHKQLSAQAFKVYKYTKVYFVSLCERRIQNQHMVTVGGFVFKCATHSIRCSSAGGYQTALYYCGAPFWVEGELPVFVVRPHAPNRNVHTMTVRYEYMYRATPNIYIYRD